MLAWQNEEEKLELPGLEIESLQAAGHGVEKFDMTLALGEVEGKLEGGMEYASSLYEERTAKRYVGYLKRMLEEMAEDEERVMDSVPLLSAAERKQLEEWNATEEEYESGKSVVERIEEVVERVPEAVAVMSEEEQMTYGELNRRANCLANHLRARGVKAEERVGICVERG